MWWSLSCLIHWVEVVICQAFSGSGLIHTTFS